MSEADFPTEDFSQFSDEQLAALFAAENAQEARQSVTEAPVTYASDELNGDMVFSLVDPNNFLEISRRQPGSAYVENFGVDESYQRRGFARRMLLGAAVLLSQQGVQEITSNSWTPEALMTIGATFGEDAITFFDADSDDASSNPAFAMSLESAISSSARAREYNQEHPDSELHTLIGATIDISGMTFDESLLPQER